MCAIYYIHVLTSLYLRVDLDKDRVVYIIDLQQYLALYRSKMLNYTCIPIIDRIQDLKKILLLFFVMIDILKN